MRDALRSNPSAYRFLDPAQLVKHAFGLVTEAGRVNRSPVLLYLYVEPSRVAPTAFSAHRAEIEGFSAAVRGARVRFAAVSWSDWLKRFDTAAVPSGVRVHAEALRRKFEP